MNRTRLLTALVAAALALSACAGQSIRATAAVVDGHRIDAASFESELRALADNAALQRVVTGNQGPLLRSSTGSIEPQIASGWLAEVVQDQIVTVDLRHRGLAVSQAQRDASAASAASSLGGAQVFAAFPKWFRDRVTDRTARSDTLFAAWRGAPPTEADLRAYYDAHHAELCASGVRLAHILVQTQAEAQAIEAQLAAGADFATLAAQKSIDSGSASRGGDLGCRGDQTYVTEFQQAADALAVGQTSAPVQTQFGWHVIRVTADSYEGARASVQDAVGNDARQRFQLYLRDQLQKADVTVDPRYGHLFASTTDQIWSIVPPDVPSVRDVPGPAGTGSTATTTTTVPPGAPTTTTTAPTGGAGTR